MKRTILVSVVVVAVVLAALGYFGMGRAHTSAVKTCRADARLFAEENASYQAEYDGLFGATTLAQRSTRDLLDRDKELMDCMGTEPSHAEQYRAVVYQNSLTEGNRYLAYMIDTKQLQDFAQWERGQQSTQLAACRGDSH
jgi:hypothetical protein